MPHYRPAVAADQAGVVQLMGELVDELGPPENAARVRPKLAADIEAALHSADVRIFVAEQQAELIGLSRADILHHDPIFRLRDPAQCGYVDQMFVQPAYRDCGVGAHLLALCEGWFRARGIAHCLLHAAPKAVRFYARVGYQPNREMFKKL